MLEQIFLKTGNTAAVQGRGSSHSLGQKNPKDLVVRIAYLVFGLKYYVDIFCHGRPALFDQNFLLERIDQFPQVVGN